MYCFDTKIIIISIKKKVDMSPVSTSFGEQQRRVTVSLPFLFTVGVLIFFISFLISSFPLGRSPLKKDKVQRVYFADNIGPGHAEIIRRFNALHDGKIEVVAIDLPFTKFNTNQRKELIARNLRSRSSRIDVFSVDLIWVPRFTKWAEPLTPYFAPATLAGMLTESLQTCYVNGVLYAIPLYADIGALYYREDLIRALPHGDAINERIQNSISWEELLALRAKYFANQAMYVPQAVAYEGLICNFNEILGRPLQDPETGELLNFTDSLVVQRVQFFKDLFESGFAPQAALNLTEDDCIRYALGNDIPFVRGWPTVNNETDTRFDPEKFDRLSVAPLPHFEGNLPTPVFGGWNMMLSHHSPVKDAAILFMQFASSVKGQTIFYESDGLLPVQKDFYTGADTSARHARLQRIRRTMETGILRPALPEYTLISDILSSKLHQILSGELDTETGLAEAETAIRKVVSKEVIF